MGILADFIIKHVRPADGDAFQELCNENGLLWDYLVNHLDMSAMDIRAAFTHWAIAVDEGLRDDTIQNFVAMAQAISQARWDELYTTSRSTILFLTRPLIAELSAQSGNNPNATFVFEPAELIPLAVTINRDGSPPTVNRNVSAIEVATDSNGNCVHFGGLN